MATKQDNDVIEIADLEFEIGAANSIEAGEAHNSNDVLVIYYLPPR